MSVLLVADVVGGVRTYLLELSRQLVRRGVEVNLALLGRVDRELITALRDIEPAYWEARDLRLEWMEGAEADVSRAAEWVDELISLTSPDVVHMNTFTPVARPGLPVLLTVHSCVLTWWQAVHGQAAPDSWDSYRQLAAGALERADQVIAPTRWLLHQLRAVYSWNGPAQVIPNGRRVPGARPLTAANFRDRERLVVSVGRVWDAAKNASLLAAAAPRIDGRVVVIGPGRVSGLDCLGRLGEQEVVSWLSRARAYAEPARYEPFGLGALEAALCGCPLVLGDVGSLREVWGPAAQYVPVDDPVAVAEALKPLLTDEQAWRRAARAALERAARYRPEAMAEAYLDAYSAVLPEGARS